MRKTYSAAKKLKNPDLFFSIEGISSFLNSFFSGKVLVLILGYLLLAGISLQSSGQSIGAPTVSPNPVCAGSNVTITFSVTNGTGGSNRFTNSTSYQAYLSNSSGGSFAAVGATFTVSATYSGANNGVTSGLTKSITIPAGTPTGAGYKISIGSTSPTYNGSSGANGSSNFTVNSIPTITGSTPGSVCGTGAVTLSATSSAGTINWYAAASGGSSLGTGNTFATPSISSTTTYYVDATLGSCVTASRTAVIATVKPIPTITGTTPGSVCGTGSVTLGATSSAGTINWYAAASGGASLGTGNTFATPSISSTTIYYVDATLNGCTTASRTAVVATVNPIPTITGTTPGNSCGTGSVTLAATASAGTINWYAAASGGLSLGTGNTFATPSISSTTTYYVDATLNGCTTASRTAVVATIKPVPIITGTTPAGVCVSGSVTLAATASAGTINWYAAASGGLSLGTGNTFATPFLLSTTTYYVDATLNGCTTTSRTAVVATVTPLPTITGTTPGSICGTGSVTLAATSSAGTINWYAALTGGSSLGAGNTFATPTISSTTIYYVDATLNGCTTATRTAVTATVKPFSTLSSSLTPPAICNNTTFSYTATSATIGTSFSWTRAIVAGISNSAGSGGTASVSETLINTTDNPVSVNYVYSLTHPNGCVNSQNVVVVIKPTPDLSSSLTQSTCSNTLFSYTATSATSGTSFSWTRAAVAGISNSASSGATASISETLVNTTNDPIDVTYVYTLSASSCGNTQSVVVTVNPTPLLTSTLTPAAICNNTVFNYTPTSLTLGTTFNWTRAVVAGISNAAGSGSGNPGETLINTTASAVNVTYVYSLTANGCTNPSTYNVVVSVKPNSSLSSSLTPPAICNNTTFSYTATSATSGTSFSWTRAVVAGITNSAGSGSTASINETLINTTASPISVTYVYSLTHPNACGNTQNVVVVVKPTPVLSSILTSPTCNNAIFTYIATSATSGTSFSWTRAIVAGISNSAGSGGTASISEALINTTANPVNVTYVYTLSANSCGNTQNVVVTVNPTPLLTSTLTPAAICNNTAFNYTPTSLTSGTTFNWTRAAVAGISNAAGSGSGNPGETLINTTASAVNVTYVYSLTANGCTNPSTYNVVVSVKPTPTLSSTLTPSAICNNTTFSYTATSATTGTGFSWTRAAVSGISNAAGSGVTASISETLVNTTTSTINVTYVYTLVANGCSNTQSVVVPVYGLQVAPVISSPQTVCLFTNPALLTGTAALGGSLNGINYTYQWQRSTSAGGPWSDISGATSLTYQPPNTGLSYPDYYYRLVATDLCGVVISNSIWVEVVGGGSLTFSATGFPSATVCPGTTFTGSISAIHFSSSAVRYSWSANSAYITPATGGPVGTTTGSFLLTSTGSIGPLTVKNNTTTTQTVTITITPGVYNYSAPTLGSFLCNSSQTFVDIDIYPTPVVTATPALTTICSGGSTAIALSSNVTDNPTNYSWTAALQSGSATGFSNQASYIAGPINQTITNTGTTDAVIRYTITPMANCVGLPVTVDITVKPVTNITTTGTMAAVCASASAQTTTLAYTATTNSPISYSIDWATLTDQVNTAFSFLPGGGTLTGITIPAGTAAATYNGTMTITTLNGCTKTQAVSVTVNAIPTVTVATSTVCGGAPATVTATPGASGTYSYAWTVPSGATNPGSVASFTTSFTGNYSVIITNTATGCVSASSNTATVTTASNTWTGAISSNWSVTGNWSCGIIPTSLSDVIVPTGVATMPQLTGVSVTKSLTLQTGTTLDLNGQDYTSYGGITGSGKLKGSSLSNLTINAPSITSTIIFDQTTDGSTNALNNLTVNGTATSVTLSNKTAIYGTLAPIAGTLTLNDILVLRSTSTGTAMVGQVSGAITYGASGKVQVERYYPSRRAWRLITAPLSGTGSVFSTWQNGGVYSSGKGMWVTGPTAPANGLDVSPQSNFSLRTYNGTAFTGVSNTVSTTLSSNAASAANQGFFTFVRGDRTASNFNTAFSNTTTLSSSGTLQTGDQTFNGIGTIGAYTLIGNPYAAPIDFAKLTRSNLDNSFYAWDPYLSTVGGYVFMTETFTGSGIYSGLPARAGGQTGIIQSSQAFFVKTTGASPSLLFKETSKSSVNNLNLFRPMSPNPATMPSFTSNLSFYDDAGNTVLADGNSAKFDDSYNAGVDLLDALKFNNINETFGILSGTTSLVLSCRPLLSKQDTIFFKLANARQFKYQFEFEPIELNQDNLAGFLEDQFLHTVTPINMDNKTKVDFEVTGNVASATAERFRIVFKPSIVYTDLTANVFNSDIGIEWHVASEFNIKGYDIERSTDSIHFTKVAERASMGNTTTPVEYNWVDVSPAVGYYYYRIRSISNNNVIGYSNVVKVKLNESTPDIYVFPNPITENKLQVQMNSMAKGVYATRLINNLGQVINTNNINHLPGTATETIQLKNKLLSGVYQLEVSAPDKTTTTIQVFVK